MDEKYRIVISECSPNSRIKYCSSINNSCNFTVAGTYTDPTSTLTGIRQLHPDAMLIELDLTTENNVNLIRRATDEYENLRVLVISEFSDERHVINAIEAGASGYILYNSDDEEIREAIERLVAGDAPICPSVNIHLLKKFHKTRSLKSTNAFLTAREDEVLKLLAKGLTYTEISNALNITINTTRVHMKNLFHKFSVHSRGEAVYEAIEKGFLSLH